MLQPMESFADTEVQKIQFNSQELLAVLVASASILSLSGERYQDDIFREIYIPRDLVNLTFGVPLLFASAYETSLIPGVLAYQLYSSLTYVLAFRVSPGWVFFLHLIVLWMSASKFWETTEGFKIFSRKQTSNTDDNADAEEPSSLKPPFKYAGFIVIVWGIVVSLRSSLRMELFFSYFGNQSLTESAVDASQLLVGVVWMMGGIQLCRHANAHLGLCLLLQLSAFIYGSLLILMIQYCVMEENADDSSSKVEDAAALGIMAVSVLLPLERFISQVSSMRANAPKVLEG
mmetsp:Transcript_26475/g.64509  ORF Transcript_26475/g.64509 Transcript_26475/m.64509 type:complete len:289 (+) Transcript_26475:172-1038(+)|eukprot:CAMPEP_0113615296 /NCGR_PEP_ID=MMETSP0017_2-20120614/7627_1 /TAXON_ID=2856 /ORGANISM="Cylindrotheca closterium" /LENGTH=288 /DNA_ID=CAMNT_0000524527 /DNA_START=57 /DNA_END=923 /DNA_ORIENTATION=- /assembly_acc=CAM_ASM_000147